MKSGRQAVEYFFELSLYLFIATGFVAVAATGKLDLPTLLVVSATLGIRGLAFVGRTRVSLSASTVNRLTIAYMLFYALDFLAISGSFVFATGHLVFFLLVMKLFSARTNRDYLYLCIIAFMEMLLAAVLTINTTFLGLFAIFLLFGIATFTSFEMHRAYLAAEENKTRMADFQGGPDIVTRSLGLTAVMVTFGVLVLGGTLFFFIPRFTTGYLSNLAPQGEHVSGFSNNVLLGEIGSIKQSSMVVMHVRLNNNPSDLARLRWRGVGLTSFDGRRWVNNTVTEVLNSYSNGRYILPGRGAPFFPGKLLNYTVLLEPLASDAVFVAPTALSLTGQFRMLEVDAADSVLRRDQSYAGLRYNGTSHLHIPPPDILRDAGEDYPPLITQRYLQLPVLDPRIKKLAADVTKDAATPYDKANVIELHLKNKYGYTLDMASQGADPIADFLFNVRRGHCEYFASSMTVMLRSLGIPSRIVNGFLPGEYNDITQQYVVRGRDAHTWVEVFFPNQGWITFDPTPAAGTISSMGWGRFSQWMDAFRTFWSDWVVAYDFSRQFLFFRQMDRSTRQATNDTQSYFHRRYETLRLKIESWHGRLQRDPTMLRRLIQLVALIGGLILFWQHLVNFWRGMVSRARVRSGKAGVRDVTLAYQRFLAVLERRGIARTPSMTARQLAAQVTDPALAQVTLKFTDAYEEARFGGRAARLAELYDLIKAASVLK